jgi:hypothetical protein
MSTDNLKPGPACSRTWVLGGRVSALSTRGQERGKREVTIGTAHTVTVNSLIESNKQTKSRARVFQSHSQYRKKLLFYLHDYKITFAESSRVIFQIAYDLEWNPLIDLLVTGLNKDKALRWREARV